MTKLVYMNSYRDFGKTAAFLPKIFVLASSTHFDELNESLKSSWIQRSI